MPPRAAAIWAAVALAMLVPLVVAAQSPLLQWRGPVYIIAGFAGVAGLALLLLQPVLIAGTLPAALARRLHIWSGAALVCAVAIHVAGLWITSPPDVVDVLLLRSPAPFSIWGALALWALVAAALLGALKRRVALRLWRLAHSVSAGLVVLGTIAHAWLVDGTMGTASKAVLCALVLGAFAYALRKRRLWRILR